MPISAQNIHPGKYEPAITKEGAPCTAQPLSSAARQGAKTAVLKKCRLLMIGRALATLPLDG